ncbi:MAG: CRISPR-associated helicase Cas3' [Syntrophales bacterium]|jgi:CRISPR-associated endonuclease/helicase Cas3|nr:CRISPR-associated helicase Cas3' [Syntrophales bacterium]MCK9528312.1 CRISPR-associated helicase Cas3' [Syntrophales bacterium]MDX9922151.1 CRISPR-associated helicase Cas3' [Syntrophales bacterium]
MTETTPSYYQYWGKVDTETGSYHLLPYHCLDVAAVGHSLLLNSPALRQKIATITGLEEKICIHWLIMGLALHDIGKFSETFQNLRPDILKQLQGITSNKEYTVRHDSLGYLFLKSFVENGNPLLHEDPERSLEEWQDVIMSIAKSFTGHHGVPPQLRGLNGMPLNYHRFFGEADSAAAASFIKDIDSIGNALPDTFALPSPYDLEGILKKASWLVAGFTVLCDWIGSNSEWFRYTATQVSLQEYWETIALPQSEFAIRASGISTGSPLVDQPVFSGLFPSIPVPTPLQAFVDQCPTGNSPHLFILEDITGSGKTEAALLLAGRLMAAGQGNGLFVALPTMATSNAMYGRLTNVYRRLFKAETRPSLVLAHSARHLSDTFMSTIGGQNNYTEDEETATAQCSSWLADNRKKAQLADVGVGTLDQALLAILPARFQSLRLFGLVNHILIIDEVHAYDPYMNKLLQNLLTFHAALGGSAILLSATLPAHTRRGFINAFANGCDDHQRLEQKIRAYPMITSYTKETGLCETPIESMPQRRCSVKVLLIDEEVEIINRIVEAIEKGHCVCWIRNTVYDALDGYERLKRKVHKNSVMLFHARFTLGDRLDIENEALRAFGKTSTESMRRGKVLVATQVVEQSLDLDFDLLITDLAPMDLLIQRGGRLHRHARDEKGNPIQEGPDRRESPCMIIYGPWPEENADSDWFKSFFPKAAFVYPSHGCLWLSAKLLSEKKHLTMPDDARMLIEAAFSESAETIPESLQHRDQQAEAKWQADKTLAHINMLKLDEGYEATVTQWREDMKTPTRLGAMETAVRLACWDGAKLTPWYPHKRFPWDMSQVNIRSSLVNEEVIHDGVLGEKVASLKDVLPDKGKWTILVVLQQNVDGHWRGKALNKKNETVLLEYSRLAGAKLINEGGINAV